MIQWIDFTCKSVSKIVSKSVYVPFYGEEMIQWIDFTCKSVRKTVRKSVMYNFMDRRGFKE